MLAAVCTWSGRRLLDATGRASIVPPANALLFVCYTGPAFWSGPYPREGARSPDLWTRYRRCLIDTWQPGTCS